MTTNFFKISIRSQDFNVQRLPFAEATLVDLRARYNFKASFLRHDDFIYISPDKGSQLNIAPTTTLSVSDNLSLTESLVRHLIFRTFRNAFPNRVLDDFAPLRFPSLRPEHDPLASIAPMLKGILGFPRITEVHVRHIIENGQPRIGLLVLNRHRWRFRINLLELNRQGFSLKGVTVLQSIPVPGLQGVLAPDENVLGELERVDGDNAVILTNEGKATRPLAELYLQRNRHQIGRYLEYRLGAGKARYIFSQLRTFEEDNIRKGSHFRDIMQVADWFSQQTFENNEGFGFSVTRDPSVANNGMRLEPTKLVFDYGPGASANKPLGGLVNHGPFDSSQFDRKHLRILAMFQARNRGAATQFVAQLINGIPSSTYFKKGLRELFRLHEVDHTLQEVRGDSAEDYECAIDEAVNNVGAHRFDVALVECDDNSYERPISQNPYYRAKARLMSFGIPVQCIRNSHLRQNPTSLGWTLGPVALQMYAKLGGIPWLLPGSQSVDAELIVGIGNTILRDNQWAGAEQCRIVGLTTFFLGDGRYIMGQELRTVPYNDYFAELLRSLEESIRYVSAEYAWKDGHNVRIVFHVFKPLKNVEADVIERLVSRFPNFNIRFAFVTISTEHPWIISGDSSRNADGSWQTTPCQRGASLILDDHACLLQLKGESDRPNKKHRQPLPVLIKIHERSSYKDLPFIVQQVLDFSYLSWRSFYPNELPVTIFYATLMAQLSAKLQRIPGWNPAFLNQHFRRKAWYL